MAPRKLFGSLNLEGFIGKGENPAGFVAQTPNATTLNGRVNDGLDDDRPAFRAHGPRWNRRLATMQDRHMPKPVAVVATPRK
jgi:hypothetical protein